MHRLANTLSLEHKPFSHFDSLADENKWETGLTTKQNSQPLGTETNQDPGCGFVLLSNPFLAGFCSHLRRSPKLAHWNV